MTKNVNFERKTEKTTFQLLKKNVEQIKVE